MDPCVCVWRYVCAFQDTGQTERTMLVDLFGLWSKDRAGGDSCRVLFGFGGDRMRG